MADTLLTPTEINRRALKVFHNNLTFVKNCNRDYDDRFANSGASVSGKIGPTLQIRRPVQFTVRTGNVAAIQDTVETKIDLTVSTLKGIDWDFSEDDLALTIDEFEARYLQPAMARLSSQIDLDCLAMYQQVWNQVGTPGTVPSAVLTYLGAAQKLDENCAPRDGNRHVVVNPAAMAATVDARKGLFQSSSDIADQYETGLMGMADGFKYWMDQNIRVHTVGTKAGTPTVNGASQGATSGWTSTSTVVTAGWTASSAILKKGDVLTLAGSNAVNPETKQDLGYLQQFVVTADISADGGGAASIVVSPAIITGGAYQTVTASPTNGGTVTVTGTGGTAYAQSLAFHRDAFTFVTADLELPKGMDMAARNVKDNISLRFIRGYDILNNRRISRFDVLYGFVAQRPEWAVRLTA